MNEHLMCMFERECCVIIASVNFYTKNLFSEQS